MNPPENAPQSRQWDDLRPRVLSAVAMIAIGGSALWAGGIVFAGLAVLATGVMMWELAQMTRAVTVPNSSALDSSVPVSGAISLGLGAFAAATLAWALYSHSPYSLLVLVLPALVGLVTPRRDKAVFAAYAMVIMLTGLSLVALRHGAGLQVVLWLLAVVIVSDVMGYFAGRLLGGPKFWPRVSPKKTWSGTVAGWFGAAVVGFVFWTSGMGSPALIWFSPLVAFAGQMGDIAESAIKRRAGVKDSSNLIPGHGGLLDRFDALAFASILVGVPTFIGAFLHLMSAVG